MPLLVVLPVGFLGAEALPAAGADVRAVALAATFCLREIFIDVATVFPADAHRTCPPGPVEPRPKMK